MKTDRDEERDDRPRAVAFDVDAASLVSLRQALTDWEIEVRDGATTASLARDWNPLAADLLVIGAGADLAETLGLCRGMRSQAGRALTPLLVLVPPERQALVRAVLDAGADSCLVLPVHIKDLVGMAARAQGSNRPGRHTLNLDTAQTEDRWRDDGGQG